MSKIKTKSIKIIFYNDNCKIVGILRTPSGMSLSNYMNHHRRFLPVHNLKFTQLSGVKENLDVEFAYVNTKKYHLIIPDQSNSKNEGGLESSVSLKKIMSKKLHTVKTSTTVLEAFNLLRQLKIHHLPVLENKKFVGLLSKSDLGMKVWHGHEATVDRSMKTEIITAHIDDSFKDAIKKMVSNEVTCLPVLDGKKLVGLVTQRDLFKFVYKDIFIESY